MNIPQSLKKGPPLMLEPHLRSEVVEDRWEVLVPVRFVGPQEWNNYVATQPRSLILFSLAPAFAAAADDAGEIIDFRLDEFFERHVSDALRDEEDDPPGWALTYDRFAATVLPQVVFDLVAGGLLAHRGNGDTYDYRLTIPTHEGDRR